MFFVGTGTAANSLALASVNRPGGVSFCHSEAHVIEDECGAPEFFTHGARLVPVEGEAGKMNPADLKAEIGRFPPGSVHAGQPMAVSMTQSTEVGTVYTPAEIEMISGIASGHDLPLHMDGARFANALVHLGLTPAEMTWKRGVDIVSFGATKNGCWCAEALVFLDPEMATDLPFIRKRAAQLFSKSRFIAAQFDAYLSDGLWLDLARHSNAMADRLREGIAASSDARLGWADADQRAFPDPAQGQGGGAAAEGCGGARLESAPGRPRDGRAGRGHGAHGDELRHDARGRRAFRRAARLTGCTQSRTKNGAARAPFPFPSQAGSLQAVCASICLASFAELLVISILRGFMASGNLADEIDVKQAILQRSALHLDVVGELEATLESALGDAAVQDFGLLRALVLGLLGLDGQRVLARLDRELILAKAGNGHGDAIGVLAGSLDVVGRDSSVPVPAGRDCPAW